MKIQITHGWLISIALVISVICVVLFFVWNSMVPLSIQNGEEDTTFVGFEDLNLENTRVDISTILPGGPGKDGIPALVNPAFELVADVSYPDDAMGILVTIDGDTRYYPYAILVWHEIVNDRVGGKDIAVTFCPLCGTAIVYDRGVDDDVLEFGVSGYLHESNMITYDRQHEHFWAQATGRVIVGDDLDAQLNILPMQVLSFAEVKVAYPHARVLSTDTGYKRNYTFYPYGNYSDTEQLLFPVSVQNKQFFTKELMYAFWVGDTNVAFPRDLLQDGATKHKIINRASVRVTRKGSEINVFIDDMLQPGYYEMWFSWATQHVEDGYVWQW